jgi:hypothetical protein
LDIASYTSKPPKLPAGWTTFALWQYRPGDPEKSADHDRDVVNDGMAGLTALAWPGNAGRSPKIPPARPMSFAATAGLTVIATRPS